MQRAIILGSSGQDGKILYEKLEHLGYENIGITKSMNNKNNFFKIQKNTFN